MKTPRKILNSLCGLILTAVFASPAAINWQPFEMQWRADGEVAADASFLLDAPAGKDGFIQVRNGHLVKPDGTRFRIWGVNFSMAASTPAKEHAAAVAAHLARFGINCIRIHHLDWRTPRGIIDSRQPNSRTFDPEKIDKLDNFIAELKKRGIYVNINLNVGRTYEKDDGVKDYDQLGFAKAVTLFDRRLIELQKEYARMLLAHRNPYTGTEYRHEPAVALVEIVNENSLLESWVRGRLLGKGPGPNPDLTWRDIPPSYERDLTVLYNNWLRANTSQSQLARIRKEAGVARDAEVPRLRPDQFSAASRLRFQTEARFYMDLENRFFQEMQAYLKHELGVKAPLVGTSVHSGGMSGYPLLSSLARLDVVDGHTYWQHPRYGRNPQTGERTFEITNTPMVNDPARSTVITLGRSAVEGKPYTASEVNHPFPNEWAAEGIPILAAYAAFQDWDGVFWYSFEHAAAEDWKATVPNAFDIRQDPVKMTQMLAASLLFQRVDVRPALRVLARGYTAEQIPESLRLPPAAAPLFTPGYPPALALKHGMRVRDLTKGATPAVSLPEESVIVSDTGELKWDVSNKERGAVTINTARTQAIIGFGRALELPNLAAGLDNEFAAVITTSLDGKPLSQTGKALLLTGARVAATGQKWNEQRTTTVERGTPPTVIEPVTGTVTLRALAGAESVEAYALDGAGRITGSALPVTKLGADWQIRLAPTGSPWYVIRVKRGTPTD